jgi:hypothetical protein
MKLEAQVVLTISSRDVSKLIECLIVAYESNQMSQQSDVFAADLLDRLGVQSDDEIEEEQPNAIRH